VCVRTGADQVTLANPKHNEFSVLLMVNDKLQFEFVPPFHAFVGININIGNKMSSIFWANPLK
jgi:hypothetical protein